ncbi:MAG: hypothetical protein F6K47_42000, partial [Symploca sp. SIO2E6]|nr:hypothetical protein [Symploca sp. SIO2E6]
MKKYQQQNLQTSRYTTIALIVIAVFLALATVSIFLPEIRFMSVKLRYNNTAPIVYHAFNWKDTEASPGGRI